LFHRISSIQFSARHPTFPHSQTTSQSMSLLRSLLSPSFPKNTFHTIKTFSITNQIRTHFRPREEKHQAWQVPETMKAVAQAASQSAATTPSPVRFRQQAPPHSQGPQRGLLYTSSCRHRSPPRQQLASQQLGTAPRPGPFHLHFKIILETNPSLSSLLIMQSNRGNAALTRLRKS
jgi:hypothetical protein